MDTIPYRTFGPDHPVVVFRTKKGILATSSPELGPLLRFVFEQLSVQEEANQTWLFNTREGFEAAAMSGLFGDVDLVDSADVGRIIPKSIPEDFSDRADLPDGVGDGVGDAVGEGVAADYWLCNIGCGGHFDQQFDQQVDQQRAAGPGPGPTQIRISPQRWDKYTIRHPFAHYFGDGPHYRDLRVRSFNLDPFHFALLRWSGDRITVRRSPIASIGVVTITSARWTTGARCAFIQTTHRMGPTTSTEETKMRFDDVSGDW